MYCLTSKKLNMEFYVFSQIFLIFSLFFHTPLKYLKTVCSSHIDTTPDPISDSNSEQLLIHSLQCLCNVSRQFAMTRKLFLNQGVEINNLFS